MFLYIKIDMYRVSLKSSMYYLSNTCLVILKDRQTAVHKQMPYRKTEKKTHNKQMDYTESIRKTQTLYELL